MRDIFRAIAELPYEHSPYFDKYITRHRNGSGEYDEHYSTDDPDLRETPVSKNYRCLYCGSPAHPIQAGLANYHGGFFSAPSHAYEVTGYYCDCIHAETYLEVTRKLEELNAAHAAAHAELSKEFPRINQDIKVLGKFDSDERSVLKRLLALAAKSN